MRNAPGCCGASVRARPAASLQQPVVLRAGAGRAAAGTVAATPSGESAGSEGKVAVFISDSGKKKRTD